MNPKIYNISVNKRLSRGLFAHWYLPTLRPSKTILLHWRGMAYKNNREVEIKLRVADANELRRRLAELGATSEGRMFEQNTLYDRPGAKLRKSGQLLRIRIEIPAPGSGQRHSTWRVAKAPTGTLTYKGAVRSGAAAHAARSRPRATGKRYKEREELELTVQNPAMLDKVLSALGYRPGFRYEKFRTTYRLRALPHLAVDLDETPVGVFLELEGPRAAIDRAASLLGYSQRDYSDQTYWDVYRDYRRQHGLPLRNMVFSD